MNALITYDLKSDATDHNEVFLAAAQTEGLIFVIRGAIKDKVFRLPQSTVWGQFPSMAHAIAAFNRAIAVTSSVVEHEVVVRKRLVVEFDSHRAASNSAILINPDYIGVDDYETALLHQENVSPFRLPRARMLRVRLAKLAGVKV